MPAFGGDNAESYYDDGITASMKGDVDGAIRLFEKAIHLDNSFLAAHHQLAKCLLRKGDPGRAARLLAEVVKRKPHQSPPRLDLGYALLGDGQVEEAQRQFEQLISLDSANTRAQLGLGYVCFEQGQWAPAAMHAEAALGEGGSNFAALFLLGRALKLSGDPTRGDEMLKKADALIEKSIELNPDQPEGHYLRGEVSFARDQFSTALEHYRAADDRAKSGKLYTAFGDSFADTDILVKQGLCYQRLGKFERAAELADRVLARNPDDRRALALKEGT